MKTKFIISVLSAISFAYPCHFAAKTVNYSYDSAGNRVKREIVLQKAPTRSESTNTVLSESFSRKDVKIFPNPTYGELTVEIKGLDNSDSCLINIYSLAGQCILSSSSGYQTATFDISRQPNGIYILEILLNGEKATWKIIKK